MDVTIRPCGPADAVALSLVGQATFLETYAGSMPGEDILLHCQQEHSEAYYAERLGQPGYRFWIAEVEGSAPVGYAMNCPPDLPVARRDGDVELKRIYLLHRFHGRGVGAGLMDAALLGARQAGGGRLLLGVWGGNARAMAFYGRQGFTRAGERKFRVGAKDYDDLVLARPL